MMYHEPVASGRVVVNALIGIGFFGDSIEFSINQPVMIINYIFFIVNFFKKIFIILVLRISSF
jgi:hypothetical protein